MKNKKLSLGSIRRKIVYGVGNYYLHDKYAEFDVSCFNQLEYKEIHDYKTLEYPGKRSKRWR